MPPFHRPPGRVAKPADRQRVGRDLEVALLGAGWHHRADVLAAALKPDAGAGGELVVRHVVSFGSRLTSVIGASLCGLVPHARSPHSVAVWVAP